MKSSLKGKIREVNLPNLAELGKLNCLIRIFAIFG